MVTTLGRVPNYFLMVFGVGLPHPPEGGFYGINGGYILGAGVSAGESVPFWARVGVDRARIRVKSSEQIR